MHKPVPHADTLAIIFHGVGDHSAADIVREAQLDIKAAFSDGIAAEEVELGV